MAICPLGHPMLATTNERTRPGQLADLIAGVINCTVHPCIGDDAEVVLAGKIVTDGVQHYSDMSEVYSPREGLFPGLVEWDSRVGVIAEITFTVLAFDAPPELLLRELETALPGCRMQERGRDGKEWTCVVEGLYAGHSVQLDAYCGSGLVMLRLSSED